MYRRSLPISIFVLLLTPVPLLAQSITPANDGTGTQIIREGDRYTITGGTRTQENLFHSFQQLGLSTDEIATFLTQPGIENILGRVTGGNASILNGLVQVQDGANLYLMNPAGIVFGPNARLDLSGSFLATTANGMGFGNNWFNAFGDNSYADLVGNPDSFAFSLANSGSIVNFADLRVPSGESITLLGGTVANTGTLTAPSGTITLAAVPGENRVRLSQSGNLLSLELEAVNGTWDAALNPVNLTPLSLPQLLTGGNVAAASQITVNPDGTVRLGGANVPVQDGTTLVAGALNAAGTGGEINVLGDRVALLDANLNASGTNGGTIRIGGDYQGQGNVFNASRTYVSQDSAIAVDASGQGDGGRAIIWADDTTQFLGTVSARGGAISGDGGFVEVSGAQNLLFNGQADLTAVNGQLGTLLLDPTNITIVDGTGGVGTGGNSNNDTEILDGQVLFTDSPEASFTLSEGALEALASSTNVLLEASNDITVNTLNDGAITFQASFGIGTTGSITFRADADNSGVGDFVMNEGSSIIAAGRDITISGANINVTTLDTSSAAGNGGAITLSAGGTLTTGNLNTYSRPRYSAGNGGAITLTAGSDITTESIDSSSLSSDSGAFFISTASNGGAIILNAGGNITTNNLNSSSESRSGTAGDGGAISLTADGDSTTGFLNSASNSSSANSGNGGAITLTSTAEGGDIEVNSINADGSAGGIGGTVDITVGRFFRATGSTLNRDGVVSSISSTGGQGGGAITVLHGGNGNTPFVIGENFGENGSVGAITDGVNTFAVGESIPGSETRGNVQILTEYSSPPSGPPSGPRPRLPRINCSDTGDCGGGGNEPRVITDEPLEYPQISATRDTLLALADQTGIPPALIYISFASTSISLPNGYAQREAIASQQITNYLGQPNSTESPLLTAQPQASDELELLLVLPSGDVVRHRVEGVTRAMVLQQRQQLINEITAPNRLQSNRYRVPAQQLYEWLIAPLEANLETQNIGNLAFILDTGLRSLPLSVLYDGEQFLIERYSIGLMPSVSLTDTQYHDLRQVPILAMGASQFDTLQPLPAVPIELEAVTAAVPNSVAYLNQDFTEVNLLKSRYERPYSIVHLATHAEFLPGQLENSFIQFGDRRLPMDALRDLRLNSPAVELLVLSACKTALGDEQAELGFGGLAVQAGVRSVLASLWYVSDTGTLAFMSEFYQQLQEAPTRSEALRQTQLALLRGEIQLTDNQLITTRGAVVSIPSDIADTSIDLTHPYFWASFTMIGSPW
ncbi:MULTISPECIES: CHAT domain-containing protein [unclassified Leptolyngbya]|nr:MULTISPECIES: CHAT domain-containing protein [unclassified Leptolyngbya]MBD2156696.1 CHAT domain-containing protein [Leptolyngbya sp. FACHB-16]